MRLKKLLKELSMELYRGSKDVEITGLTENSKRVVPGNLYVVKKSQIDANVDRYIQEALSAGAAAILAPTGNPFLKDVVQLIHPDIPSITGKLANIFYEYPSQNLFTVGVTGTNGKTTVTYLLKHLLDSLGYMTGVIGTVEYMIGTKRCTSDMTTPDVISNHKMLKEMVNVGCKAAAIEVSSHGLMQGRVDEIDFDVAVFTNLTRDHLDYHQTFDAYAQAKRRLFQMLKEDRKAIVYHESPWTQMVTEGCKAQVLSYGFVKEATLYASDISLSREGTSFKVSYEGKSETFTWTSIGRHNVLNAMAAILVMLTKGFSLKDLVHPLSKFRAAPGRLERVGNSSVFVDYAHTPDALENVLSALTELKKGRIITVFGCGGERDLQKRPMMASIAERFSDHTIVTSDNPRSENPMTIISDIEKGFSTKKYAVVADRAEAIKQAIEGAKEDDLILIAGKGHETYQLFAHQRIAFDDRKVAEGVLQQR